MEETTSDARAESLYTGHFQVLRLWDLADDLEDEAEVLWSLASGERAVDYQFVDEETAGQPLLVLARGYNKPIADEWAGFLDRWLTWGRGVGDEEPVR